MTSPSASAETQKLGGGYKFLGWLVLPLLVMILVILFSHRGLYQIYLFRQERVRLEQENVRLAAENVRLARTIDRLQHDPILIQDLIRQELNFVKKNEIIFQFPPETPAVATPGSIRRSPPAARVLAVSPRKVVKSKWGSPVAAAQGRKRASQRRN